MKDIECVYAVSYIKTLENKMLSTSDMLSLIASDGAEAAKRLLTERGWTGETIEELLKNELRKAYDSAYEVCSKDSPIDILLYENDFHNMKTVLKAYVASAKWDKMVLHPSTVDPELIEKALKSGDYTELPKYYREVLKEAYQLITSTMDGQLTEIFIDKAEHKAVLKRAAEEKNDFIIGWAKLLISLSDCKTAWRCALGNKSREFINNALIEPKEGYFGDVNSVKEYIKSVYDNADVSSVSSFEKWCDNKKLAYAKKAKAESFGFAPILAFLIGKSYEVQAVRIILTCKENGLSEEVIKERLRDMYV